MINLENQSERGSTFFSLKLLAKINNHLNKKSQKKNVKNIQNKQIFFFIKKKKNKHKNFFL